MLVAREVLLITTIVLMVLYAVSLLFHFIIKKVVVEDEKKEKIMKILNLILICVSISFVVSAIAFAIVNIFASVTF